MPAARPHPRRLLRIGPALLLLALAAAARADDREPVPPDAEQAEALKLLKEIFAADFAVNTPEARRALAARLLKEVTTTAPDPAARYVMLREARQAAVAGGDLDAALRAVAALADRFAVEPSAMYVDTMTRLGAAPELRGSGEYVALVCLALAEVAAAQGRALESGKLFTMAASAAAKANNPTLAARAKAEQAAMTARAKSRGEELKAARGDAARAKAALQKLEAHPDDPAANLAAGRYAVFARGDWDKGLPMLAKGSDAALKDLAARDLAGPSTAAEQFRLAGVYWDLAAKNPALRTKARERAAYWYAKAHPGLRGLDKLLAERRGAGAGAAEGGGDASAVTVNGDGPLGFGSHTYRYFPAPVTWELARLLCMQMGGHLVVLETRSEIDFARKLAAGRNAWIGATDQEREGDWRWVDGTPVATHDWVGGEPDNHQGTQHSAFIWAGNGHWADDFEWQRFGFVCEWPG